MTATPSRGQRLERAAAGEERMADTALRYALDGTLELPGGRRPAHVLATDNGIR
jgi:hypothetical protein